MSTNLKALQLKARHQVYTLLSGHNLSKLHGEGYDFSELREYQMGDDIRKINWTITAKLGRPYIKELHANRELSIAVASFMDGSMYFGTDNAKQRKLTEVATVLGYAAHQNSDLFSGIAYTGGVFGKNQSFATPPTKQIYHIEQFSQKLFECALLHTTLDYEKAITDLFKRLHKPSLIFILSDFLEEVDLSLLSQKHEVVALIIRDKEEESPKKLSEITLRNPKNHMKLDTYFTKNSRDVYRQKLEAHEQKMQEHFTRYGIRSVKIFTDEEVLPKLIQLFVY